MVEWINIMHHFQRQSAHCHVIRAAVLFNNFSQDTRVTDDYNSRCPNTSFSRTSLISDDQWWFFSMFYQWTVLKERFCDTLAEQILKFALPLSSFTVKLVLYRQNGDQKLRLQRAKYSPGSRSKHKWRRLSAEYYCRYQQNSMTQVYFVSLKYFFNGSIGLVSPNINPHQR